MINALPPKIWLKRRVGRISEALHNPYIDGGSVRVLIYHNITEGCVPAEWQQMTTPTELFDAHMRYLKESGYCAVGAGEAASILTSEEDIPAKTVSITFDDGYRDNYLNAMPVLCRYGLRATVFLTSNFIGKSGYLSWSEIKEMASSGIFTFGCHSRSHRNLSRLSLEELSGEVLGAKKALEHGLGSKIDTYAYPYGWHSSFNDNVIDAVKEGGYTAAFTGIYGVNTARTDPFRFRRIRMSWLEEPDELKKIMHGAYDWYSVYQRIVSLWHKA